MMPCPTIGSPIASAARSSVVISAIEPTRMRSFGVSRPRRMAGFAAMRPRRSAKVSASRSTASTAFAMWWPFACHSFSCSPIRIGFVRAVMSVPASSASNASSAAALSR